MEKPAKLPVWVKRSFGRYCSTFVLVFHPITGAFDDNGFGVVKQSVQDGGGDGAVVVEDGGPLLEGFVGRQNDGAALVALADDLKKEVRAVLVNGQVAHFIQDQQSRAK